MDVIARSAGKFSDPECTLAGDPRAYVPFERLDTLWLNTGTLCNLACGNCYIESSPINDRLSYLTRTDVATFLEEVKTYRLPVQAIGLTGGEPFMNPLILEILEDCLGTGASILVLTDAMRPMMKLRDGLCRLLNQFGTQLQFRVSIDHYSQEFHKDERGPRSWKGAIQGLSWLCDQGFNVTVAGRRRWEDREDVLRSGFEQLFTSLGLPLDARDSSQLILFPEMDLNAEVPEISTACWQALGVNPQDMMCANSRMVVRRRGSETAEVVSCTLLPHDEGFSMGQSLRESMRSISLNHPHCARFCVLGGGSCSG